MHLHRNKSNKYAIPSMPKNMFHFYTQMKVASMQYPLITILHHLNGSVCAIPFMGKITHHLQYIPYRPMLVQYLPDLDEYVMILQILLDKMSSLYIMVKNILGECRLQIGPKN